MPRGARAGPATAPPRPPRRRAPRTTAPRGGCPSRRSRPREGRARGPSQGASQCASQGRRAPRDLAGRLAAACAPPPRGRARGGAAWGAARAAGGRPAYPTTAVTAAPGRRGMARASSSRSYARCCATSTSRGARPAPHPGSQAPAAASLRAGRAACCHSCSLIRLPCARRAVTLSLCCTCRGTLCGLWPVNRVPARPSRQRLVPGCRRSNRQAGAHRPGDMLPRLAVR